MDGKSYEYVHLMQAELRYSLALTIVSFVCSHVAVTFSTKLKFIVFNGRYCSIVVLAAEYGCSYVEILRRQTLIGNMTCIRMAYLMYMT